MDARPEGDVVVDGLGEGIGLLEHHADARAQLHHIARRILDVLAVEQDRPVTRAPAMVSFMRFRQRRKVDLPQPEGPIIASTCRWPTSRLTLLRACLAP